jgi:hypothetical protein
MLKYNISLATFCSTAVLRKPQGFHSSFNIFILEGILFMGGYGSIFNFLNFEKEPGYLKCDGKVHC